MTNKKIVKDLLKDRSCKNCYHNIGMSLEDICTDKIAEPEKLICEKWSDWPISYMKIIYGPIPEKEPDGYELFKTNIDESS
jgi:hypothetical protein